MKPKPEVKQRARLDKAKQWHSAINQAYLEAYTVMTRLSEELDAAAAKLAKLKKELGVKEEDT